MKQKTIKSVLERFGESVGEDWAKSFAEEVDLALKQIQEIMLGCVPEKQTSKSNAYSLIICRGYNQARDETLRRMGEI